jgi:photosystem II stability/assembly factor-like uncharacterized protein
MLAKIRFLAALLIAALLLFACSTPSDSIEQTDTTLLEETQNLTSPTVVPSQTPLPTKPPTRSPPTTTPVETRAPSGIASPPVPPPGPTLERLPTGQELVFDRLQMFDPQVGWATGGLAGSNDHLFTTRDAGNTWFDVTPPQPGLAGTLQVSAFFMDASTAWATFYGANMDIILPPWPVIWRTTDAGQTWQVSQLLDMSGLDQSTNTTLYFADAQHGWLITHVGAGMSHDYVTLYRTVDGGITWERLLDPYTDGQIQGCWKTGFLFQDSQVGWLTGDCGGVMAGVFLTRTEDGGTTWTYIDLPAPSDRPLLYDVNTWAACGGYDLHFFDPQSAVLGVHCTMYSQDSSDPTFAYYMYTTQDGGATWSSQPYPGETLLFVSPQNGWSLGRDIYQTTDGGMTWSKVNDVHWDARFDFISPQLGWAASYTDTEYALVVTTDGGAHWFMLDPIIAP